MGKRLITAANLVNRTVTPMDRVGLCMLPLVFAPADREFRVTTRLIPRLLYAFVHRAASTREQKSIITLEGKERFRPNMESARFLFSSLKENKFAGADFITA